MENPNRTPSEPDYSNWVSKKFIFAPGLIGLALWIASILFYPWLAVVALVFLLVSLYFAYAWLRFSPRGGDVQACILALLLRRLEWDGKGEALDIGCGNGPLAIRLAKNYPSARVTGVDYWGDNWDYSKKVCEHNAEMEGVADRVVFQKANAAALPFKDDCYDLVVSNLVFHEVGGVKDKRELVREALRVVKKGGRFAFQDLFLVERMYGDPEDLVKAVQSWGISQVEFVRTCDEPFIPRLLKLPFMVGTMGLLVGVK